MIYAVAVLNNKRAIGSDNDLVFDLPKDLDRFRRLTKGRPVIMGRKTWESLPKKPLPGRLNIVVTRNSEYVAEGATVVGTVEDAIELAKQSSEDICIMGGGEIYTRALPYTDRLYLTIVDDDRDADVYFPDYSEFTKVIPNDDPSEDGVHEENGLLYRYVTLERSSSTP